MHRQRIAYFRAGSLDALPSFQLEQLEELRHETPDFVYFDEVAAPGDPRPALDALLARVRSGDTVVVPSMDRLAVNLEELRGIVLKLVRRGVQLVFAREKLCFKGGDAETARLLLSAMQACAQFERALLLERQREGIALARERGAYCGRKRALTNDQAQELRQRAASGEPKAALAREFGISRETLYQYLRKD